MRTPEEQAKALARDVLELVSHADANHAVVMSALLGVYQSYALTYACCSESQQEALRQVQTRLAQRDAGYAEQTNDLIERLAGDTPAKPH